MPYNGSGVFTRVYNWVNDAAGGIPITASRVDTEDTGFATGLSNAICKDGQTTVTANLPMGGFRHTGVGNAVARTDYAAAGQIQDGGLIWVVAGGTADVITATYSPALTALVDGMELSFRASAANATTTPTFSPNGLTAHTITKTGGVAVAIGDIPGALAESKVRYNLANTRWELVNPATAVNNYLTTEGTIASATSTDLGTVSNTTIVSVTGPTTITSFGSSASTAKPLYFLRFTGILTLTYNATSLIIPGAANITTAAGDACIAKYEGSGNWRIVDYTKASGTSVVVAATVTPVIGSIRNGKMSVTTAAATATFNADEVIVETALGGTAQKLSSYSQSVNLGTTGAGGMDTGAAPASGFVSLYAIAKPDTTTSILACAVGTSSGSIYAGANMPAGYTFSALLGTYPTNGSSQFLALIQFDRKIYFAARNAVNTGSPTSLTLLSISSIVPANAKAVGGTFGGNTSGQNICITVAADANGLAAQTFVAYFNGTASIDNFTDGAAPFNDLAMITAQTIYWKQNNGTNNNHRIDISSYTI